MEFTQLKQFKTVAETENIVEASKILNIPQPALTKSIKNLESELGVSLFDRINKKLILNEMGKIVLSYADEMFLDLKDMGRDLKYVQDDNNLIRVCSSINAITSHLIPKFNIEYPTIVTYPQLRPANRFKKYLTGDIFDVAISQNKIEDEAIESKVLVKDWVVISVPDTNPLYEKEFIELSDLSGQYFANSSNTLKNPLPLLFEHALEANGITIHNTNYATTQVVVYEIANTDKLMYINSIGSQYIDCGPHRRYIPINPNANMSLIYYVSYLKSNKPKVDFFVKWLRNQFDSYSLLFKHYDMSEM